MTWQQLAAIVEERKADLADEYGQPPTACPNDGTPLQADPRGVLRCPFDGWRWPKDPDPLRRRY